MASSGQGNTHTTAIRITMQDNTQTAAIRITMQDNTQQ